MMTALNMGLANDNSKWAGLLHRTKITSVMPIKDLTTGFAKKLIYAKGTKQALCKAIVYIFDNTSENNTTNCDKICSHLVREANSLFDINIAFGGNASAYGSEILTSLDAKFLDEDVANLAMMSYHKSINDLSFFQDTALVRQYFQYCPNVQELFSNLFSV